MSVRYATTVKEATHRFPTSVYWGSGYFGDGMRYIIASSRDAALNSAPAQAAQTEMPHLQERDHAGEWRFSSVIIQENEDICRVCAEQPGAMRLLEGES